MHVEDAEAELVRFEEAKKRAIGQLQELYDKAVKEVGELNAQIFEIHQMMLEDTVMARASDTNQMLNARSGNFSSQRWKPGRR